MKKYSSFSLARLLFVLLMLPLHVQAQHYYFQHFQVERGLANNTATCVIQDRKGFMWIGTKDGLNRFDGYSFKAYKNNTADSSSLGNNSVWKLYEGADGLIWIGTERGMYFFDPQTEKFSRLKNTPVDIVRKIAADKQGNIWFIVGFSLYKYDPLRKSAIAIPEDAMQHCSTLAIDNSGQLWIGTQYGQLGRYDPQSGKADFTSVFSHSPRAVTNWIECIYDPGDGYLLVGTSGQGVKKFTISDHSYEDILMYNEDKTEVFTRDFIKSQPGECWIATENGIYIYHTTTGRFDHLVKNAHDPYAISDNAVYAFCKDREGGIWIGTYFGGINYYPRSNPLFEKYIPGATASSIKGNAVREITSDNNGNLWIGTEDGGLNKFTPATGVFKNFRPDGTKTGIAHTNIHGLLHDGNYLWIGTFEHGLDLMDLRTERVIRHFTAGPGPDNLRSNFIHSLYKTSDGKIWAGSANGIYMYNEKDNNFISPDYFPREAFYSSILETSDHTIWAGTFQTGLHYYNPAKKIYGRIQVLLNGKDILQQNRVTYLCEAENKTLWVATEDRLFNINLNNKKVSIYSTANGLPSNLIYTITADNLGRYWISTSGGLAMLDTGLTTIRVFTQSAGLPGDQFNYSSVFKNKDGRIYYGSVKGMISFDPATLQTDNYAPPVYITNFSVFNKPLSINPEKGPLKQSLLITDRLQLPHDQSTFNIDFAAINYTSPDNVQYAYKLEGLDKNWNYIKTNRSVYFTNLQPGTYVFKVRSTNSSGGWQDNERAFRIIITPPLWKTVWAYLLYTLLAILLIAYVIISYRRYLHNKQQRKMQLYSIQKEKELIESKIDFFTKLAHEVRTPLTLIKAPLEKISRLIEKTPQTEKYLNSMNRNTERLLELTNQLLDFRKAESEQFSLNFVTTPVVSLVSSTWSSFQPTAENRNIQFTLALPAVPFEALIDPDAFTKIITNLFDNAIKYCKQKVAVQLIAPDDNNRFSITVSNDGEPIPGEEQKRIFEMFFRSKFTASIPGAGIGLALAKSLTDLHQGSIRLDTAENLITFTVTIPAGIR